MAKKNQPTDLKEMDKKLKELKIELLKQPQKKKSIKKEIAKILTARTQLIKLGDKK